MSNPRLPEAPRPSPPQPDPFIETLLTDARVGIAFIDDELRFIRVNPVMAGMSGLPAAQHEGRLISEVLPGAWRYAEPVLLRVLETGEPALGLEMAGETAAAAGTLRSWRVSFHPVPWAPGGKARGIVAVAIETTERRLAEQALDDARAGLQLALQASSSGTCSIDLGSGQVECTDSFYAMFGLEPGSTHDVAGFLRHVMAGDRKKVAGTIRAAAAGGAETGPLEFRVEHPEGTRWLVARGRVERHAGGRSSRLNGVAFDVTDRERALARLRASEARYRSLTESIAAIVVELFPGEQPAYYNRRWYEYTGLRAGERPATWRDLLHPDDRKELPDFEHEPPDGGHWEGEFRLRHASGQYRWHLGRAAALAGPGGGVERWVGTAIDIHDRKLAEEALARAGQEARDVLDALPSLVLVLQPDGAPVFANRAALEYTGVPLTSIRAWQTNGLVHPDDVPLMRAGVARARDDGGAPLALEVRLRRHDGAYRWHAWHSATLAVGGQWRRLATATDVHERKLADEAVATSEARFRAIAEALPQIAWMTDARGKVTYLNGRFRELLGPGGEWDTTMPHPDDADRTVAAWEESLATGLPFEAQYRLRRHDGVYRWHLGRNQPVRDDSGRIVAWVGTATDIHEQKETEEALARLAAIVDSAEDAILSLDIEGRVTSWNAAAERLYGFTAAEMLGRTGMPGAIADGDRREQFARVVAGEMVRVHERHTRHDGTAFAAAVVFSPLRNREGRVIGVSAVVRDVTPEQRRQEAEARLAAIVTSSADAIISTDIGGRVTSWNQAAEELFGYGAGEAIGQMYRDLIVPEAELEESAAFWDALIAGENVQGLITRRRRKDGSEFDAYVTGSTIFDAEGRATGTAAFVRDVTGELARQQAAARLAAIVDSSEEAIIGTDLESRVLSWNRAAARLFGYPEAEVLGKDYFDIVLPAGETEASRQGHAVIRAGLAVSRIVTKRRRDGSQFEAAVTRSPVRDDHGRLVGASLIVRDITAQRRRQEAERRLAAVVSSSAEAILSTGQGDRITTWNRAAERMFGWTPQEAVGQHRFALIVPRDLWEETRALESAPGTVVARQTRGLRKDGTEFPAAVTVSLLEDAEGHRLGQSIIVRDLTEERRRQEAEARLAALVTTAPDAILTFTPDGRVTSWNEGAERIYGWPAAEAIGRQLAELVRTQDENLAPNLAAALRGEVVNVETTDTRRDGTPVPVSVILSPVRGADGAVIGGSAIVRDVTEQRRRQEELEQALAVKAEFLGSVSHELRTPLTSLVGLVNMLHTRGDAIDASTRREALDQLVADASRLQGIIENMLILARLEQAEFEPQPLLPARAIAKVVADYRRRYPGAKVEARLPPALPVVLSLESWLDQVLTNLLDNAAKYAPGQPVRVEAEDLGAFVEVRVVDGGPGLSEADAERIFDPFHRLARDRYRAPGQGLGLAVCRRLVELMGGTITAERRKDAQGAVFRFTLPTAHDE